MTSIGESGGAAARWRVLMPTRVLMPWTVTDGNQSFDVVRQEQAESLVELLAATQSSPAVSGEALEAAEIHDLIYEWNDQADAAEELGEGADADVLRKCANDLEERLLQATGKEETDSGLQGSASASPGVQFGEGVQPEPSGESDGPMPVFVLKAKDQLALATVNYYGELCNEFGLADQAWEVKKASDEMEAWREANPDQLKMPDHKHVPATPTPNQPTEGPTNPFGCDKCHIGFNLKTASGRCECQDAPTEGKDGGRYSTTQVGPNTMRIFGPGVDIDYRASGPDHELLAYVAERAFAAAQAEGSGE